jgi:hypothetical protein
VHFSSHQPMNSTLYVQRFDKPNFIGGNPTRFAAAPKQTSDVWRRDLVE